MTTQYKFAPTPLVTNNNNNKTVVTYPSNGIVFADDKGPITLTRARLLSLGVSGARTRNNKPSK